MKRGNIDVPVDGRVLGELLSRIGEKWTVPVMVCLARGPMRYSGLRRDLSGISQRMLTLSLRALERDGLVKRTVYPTVPPQVEYQLTDLGRTLLEPLLGLASWARDNWLQVERARQLFDMSDGRPAQAPRSRQPPRAVNLLHGNQARL